MRTASRTPDSRRRAAPRRRLAKRVIARRPDDRARPQSDACSGDFRVVFAHVYARCAAGTRKLDVIVDDQRHVESAARFDQRLRFAQAPRAIAGLVTMLKDHRATFQYGTRGVHEVAAGPIGNGIQPAWRQRRREGDGVGGMGLTWVKGSLSRRRTTCDNRVCLPQRHVCHECFR